MPKFASQLTKALEIGNGANLTAQKHITIQ